MPSDQKLYSGKLSDGQSAGAIPVAIAVRDTGLAFWRSDQDTRAEAGTPGETWFWDFAKLTTAHPVRPSDPDVLVHHPDMPGASLFVRDPDFTTRLSHVADHTSPSAWLWRFTKPALAITAALVAMFGAVWVFDLSPAKALASMMPDEVRAKLGDSMMTSITKERKICHSPQGDAALAKMFARLTDGDPNADGYSVQVIDWRLENAFALPGGQMILTRGLVESASSAEEVTGVLAHEIGHVVKRHPEAGVVRAMGLMVAAQFIFAGGSETLGGIGTALVALQFSRTAEREADWIGLDVLEKSSVAPGPLAGFFERVSAKYSVEITYGKADQKEKRDKKRKKSANKGQTKPTSLERNVAKSLELLSTHPPTPERIKTIRARATYDTRPVLTAVEWKALQDICKGK